MHKIPKTQLQLITLKRGYSSGSRRRVVVTGVGLVTPLGTGFESFKNLIENRSGITNLPTTFSKDLPSQVAARVPNLQDNPNAYQPFDSDKYLKRGDERLMPLFIKYAMGATQQALEQANWIDNLSQEDKENTGVCFGSGIGSLLDTCSVWDTLNKKGYGKVTPFYVPRILTNMAAGHISIRYGFQGPNHSVSTACTTGAHSLGDAFRFIRGGDANLMVAGSTEASVHDLAIAGFARAKSLSTNFNQDPPSASRPFDDNRDGFVIGEGSGCLVLEELEHALHRNQPILAEIVGYGLSGDAYHMTSPPDSGRGAYLAMQRALKDAKINSDQVTYVNAHATSTEKGDSIEAKAIADAFNPNNRERTLHISSSKGHIGHLLGAAGAVESAFTVLSIHEGILPPTRNLQNCSLNDFEGKLNFLKQSEKWEDESKIALSNSFGFGGTNATLCFKKFVK